MQEWNQQQQQQKQQQSTQPQPRTWGITSSNNGTNAVSGGMVSFLRSNQSTTLSPPSSTPRTPDPSEDSRLTPWATPSSSSLRRAQANRNALEGGKPGIITTLNDLDLFTYKPSSDDLSSNYSSLQQQERAADVKYRLRPSVGRTVHLDGNKIDLARGLGMLNAQVRINKIAQDVAKQRFHERPGLKRKRLRRERWRARFKDGFKATCSRVQVLARQGW